MKDLNLTADFDTEIQNGDFVINQQVDEQNIQLLCMSVPGMWRQYPIAGVGLVRMLNNETSVTNTELRHHINKQIRADGARVNKMTFSGTDILIDANYES